MERVHHGLITVPRPGAGARPGIYWLRLYQAPSGDHLAVVTEVPGNPGYSVANGISLIESFIRQTFDLRLRPIRLFLVTPPRRAEGLGASVTEAVKPDSDWRWPSSSLPAIEARLGTALPLLPLHDELYALVRAEGGGTVRELVRDVFEAVPVADLPFPHGLYQCEAYRLYQRSRGGAQEELGREFTLGLTEEVRSSCRYHQADWRSIADASVEIIVRLGPADAEDYEAEARSSSLPKLELRWLESLFHSPVVVNGRTFTNGQHRGCALRFSGAAAAALVVRTESLGVINDDWTYVGEA